MKKLALILSIALCSTITKAGAAHDYDCIAQSLEAYNSDIYYDLDPADIDRLLADTSGGQYAKVSSLAFECDRNARSVCDDGLLEAKFVGQIQNLDESQDSEAGNLAHTTFGVGKFISFRPNPFCGLSANKAEKASFWVQGQTGLSNGQEVSGVIRYNPSNGNFSLQGVPLSQ